MQTLNKKRYCTFLFAEKINRPNNFFLIAKAIELVKSSKYDSWEYPTKHERNDDFKRIPDVIYSYDNVLFGKTDAKDTPLIKYSKKFDDGTIMYIEEIRNKRNTLTINTLYKYKRTGNPRTFVDNNNPLSNASIYIIPHSDTNLNPNVKNDKQTTDDIIKERLSEIIKTCKPNAHDLKILKGLENILSSK